METTSSLTFYGTILEGFGRLRNKTIFYWALIIFRWVELIALSLVLYIGLAGTMIGIISFFLLKGLGGLEDEIIDSPFFWISVVPIFIGLLYLFIAPYFLINIKRASPKLATKIMDEDGYRVAIFQLPLLSFIPFMIAIWVITTLFHIRVILRYPVRLIYELIMRVISILVGIGIGLIKLICLIPIHTKNERVRKIIFFIKNIEPYPLVNNGWFDDSIDMIFAWITHPSFAKEYKDYYEKLERIRDKNKSKIREARNEFLGNHL